MLSVDDMKTRKAKMILCSHFAPNVWSNNAIVRYGDSGNGLADVLV